MSDEPNKEALFEVQTKLGFSVRTTQAYWNVIVTVKHPAMKGRETDVTTALEHPAEIRQSRKDDSMYLFYSLEVEGRRVCVVVKRLNGEGFLITTYPTDNIKEGDQVWPK